VTTQPEGPPHDLVEFLEGNKLCDRKFTDGDDELWSEKIDFIIHPAGAIPDFIRRRNAVAARGCLAGEAAADRCKINPRAHLCFVQMTELVEPPKEGAASRPGERLAQNRFPDARCLADEYYLTENRSAGNWRGQHPRAASALEQARDMLIQ
jgi:hypothetical protein